jgi:hypothetical protein
MRLQISGNKKLVDVAEEFQNFFPYLKLTFYPKSSSTIEKGKRIPLAANTLLSDVSGEIQDGYIDLSNAMSVKQLEKNFSEKCLLNVQVQRRSGNVWLETTITDNWSLEHQNDHGREITLNINNVKGDQAS